MVYFRGHATRRQPEPATGSRGVWVGGAYWYSLDALSERKAGQFGCDPCSDCGRHPSEGETVYLTPALLICTACVKEYRPD
jgi:hypothetical protein